MNDPFFFARMVDEPSFEPTTVTTRPYVSHQLVHIDLQDERVQDVVGRVQRAILNRYPGADFMVYIGTQPLGVYIDVYTDNDEFRGILQVLDDRLGNLCIAAGIPVCVAPRQRSVVKAA